MKFIWMLRYKNCKGNENALLFITYKFVRHIFPAFSSQT